MGSTVEPARELRRNQTEPEMKLWLRLRSRRLGGLKFRRQVPIAGFIADFLCEDARLIVEVDGAQHGERIAADAERTEILNTRGFEILRFWNNDVMNNLEASWSGFWRQLP
jgi:very-short-patch-repair endonuclease